MDLKKTLGYLKFLKANNLSGNNEVYTNTKEKIFKEAIRLGILPQVRAQMAIS